MTPLHEYRRVEAIAELILSLVDQTVEQVE